MRIYLDFDGVMHAATRDKLHFEHKEAFEAILRAHPHVQVVISSSWREVFSYAHMREYFADDVMHQIIGITPVLPDKLRYEEVMQHVKETGYTGEFIVLDDMGDEFPADWPHLLLCDPLIGLNAAMQEKLRSILAKISAGRMKVFIDTEFTNFFDPHLISIGIVAESGEEFYAEVPYPEKSCSAFVRDVVIPLLGQIPHAACSFDELRGKILTWLEIVRQRNEGVEICFDSQHDWDLFAGALDNRIPPWCYPRLIEENIKELLRFEFHEKNSLPEHHALYDAQANRYAFRERPLKHPS